MLFLIPTDTCWWIGCSIQDIASYEQIYALKKRSFAKPLSVMVGSFQELETWSELSTEQIDFLKNYDSPFTVLACSHILNNISLSNFSAYKKVAFRVAHNDIQKELISDVWPIFLTSANESGQPECYTLENVKKAFWMCEEIRFFGTDADIGGNAPSEIFGFIGKSCERKFLRK